MENDNIAVEIRPPTRKKSVSRAMKKEVRAVNLSPIGILPPKKIKKFSKSSVGMPPALQSKNMAERKNWRYSVDFENSKMSNRHRPRKVDFTDSMILMPKGMRTNSHEAKVAGLNDA